MLHVQKHVWEGGRPNNFPLFPAAVDPVGGCWTQWISIENNEAAAGDFENLQELINL